MTYAEMNHEKKLDKGRERYKNKRAFLLEQCKDYQRNNKTKVRKYQSQWINENREHINKKRRTRAKKRRKTVDSRDFFHEEGDIHY